MASDAQEFWIYRKGATMRQNRYAMTVVADSETPDGYRVTDSDPTVADSALLASFASTVRKPVKTADSDVSAEGIGRIPKVLNPGDPEHFEAAVWNASNDLWYSGPAPRRS